MHGIAPVRRGHPAYPFMRGTATGGLRVRQLAGDPAASAGGRESDRGRVRAVPQLHGAPLGSPQRCRARALCVPAADGTATTTGGRGKERHGGTVNSTAGTCVNTPWGTRALVVGFLHLTGVLWCSRSSVRARTNIVSRGCARHGVEVWKWFPRQIRRLGDFRVERSCRPALWGAANSQRMKKVHGG